MKTIEMRDKEGYDVELNIEDIKDSLEAEGYGVVILPPGSKFFCFHSKDRDVLKRGHEIRQEVEDKKLSWGYVMVG